MFRKRIKKQVRLVNFTPRGENSSRLESFSDGVFALAVTLLVLSSSVPETFTELKAAFTDAIPFAICIAILTAIWYEHFTFFYRYGLKDYTTVILNTALLFVVLFYVYPLKFLFRVLFSYFYGLFTGEGSRELFTKILPISEAANLMIIYGAGAVAIYLILAAMFYHAYRKRLELKLTVDEIKLTRISFTLNLISVLPPLVSVIIAVVGTGSDTLTFIIAGNIYWLYPVIIPLATKIMSRSMSEATIMNNK